MYKHIFISFLLHVIPLLLIGMPTTIPEPKQNNISGNFLEEANLPIELTEEGDNTPKNFYWGIGVLSRDTLTPQGPGLLVTDVYNGYSAQGAGIQVGDVIISVNGRPVQDDINDIKSDGPGTLILTILRNGVIIQKKLHRVKVYY